MRRTTDLNGLKMMKDDYFDVVKKVRIIPNKCL